MDCDNPGMENDNNDSKGGNGKGNEAEYLTVTCHKD